MKSFKFIHHYLAISILVPISLFALENIELLSETKETYKSSLKSSRNTKLLEKENVKNFTKKDLALLKKEIKTQNVKSETKESIEALKRELEKKNVEAHKAALEKRRLRKEKCFKKR